MAGSKSEGSGSIGEAGGIRADKIKDDAKTLEHVLEYLMATLTAMHVVAESATAVNTAEFGENVGRLYVALGVAIDRGLIDQTAIYRGRLRAGERMQQFMDRFPLERNHPDMKRLFTDVRREVKPTDPNDPRPIWEQGRDT